MWQAPWLGNGWWHTQFNPGPRNRFHKLLPLTINNNWPLPHLRFIHTKITPNTKNKQTLPVHLQEKKKEYQSGYLQRLVSIIIIIDLHVALVTEMLHILAHDRSVQL